jgi:hypothetical protein
MEPLLQGAGGMLLADPLFQATLVQVGGAHGFTKRMFELLSASCVLATWIRLLLTNSPLSRQRWCR